MSVYLADVLLENAMSIETILRGHEGYAVASLSAGFVRSRGQGIIRKPLDDDPAHAEGFGPKKQSVRNAFVRNATWDFLPP